MAKSKKVEKAWISKDLQAIQNNTTTTTTTTITRTRYAT